MVKPVKSRELLETVGQACDRFHEEAEANLKLTEHEQMVEQIKAVPTMVRNMRKSTRDMWTFLELSSGAIIAFVTLLITVTSVTLLGLYFMKESLGIDIFKDVHFFDML
jgi:hypothetical protein